MKMRMKRKCRKASIENKTRTEEVLKEHRNIVEAMRAGDADLAAKLTTEHIAHAKECMLERMNKNDAEEEGYDEKENVFNEDYDDDDDEDDDEEDGDEDISGDGIRIEDVNLGASPVKDSPGRLFDLQSYFIFLKRDR